MDHNQELFLIGERLSTVLRDKYPPASRNGYPCVPLKHVPEIADHITTIIAEVVADYLDAGSERDAVQQELGPKIEDELKGWSEFDSESDFPTPT